MQPLLLLRSYQEKGTGNHQQAINYLYQYLEVNQSNPFVWATLGQLLEQLNRLDELSVLIKRIPEAFMSRPLIGLVRAKFLRRQSDYHGALESLDLIEKSTLNDWLTATIKFEYSKIFDKLEKYDEAWISVVEANQSAALTWPKKWQQNNQLETMLNETSCFKLKQNNAVYEQTTPSFLVGFPRTGTTLLEKILDSHSDISVMDEQPIIELIVNSLGGLGYVRKLDDLTEIDIKKIRKDYFSEVKKISLDFLNKKYLIDKLPLNILYLPLIKTVFPEAKIILAMRHPIDSCLSCFFQEFTQRPPLDNFLEFEKSVEFYSQIFTSTEHLLENNSNLFTIKYEDVLGDMESSITQLLSFLDMDWEPQLSEFHQHAMKQQINTPSYHQVVKPLYTDSVYRWKNYQQHCGFAKQKLNHWIEKFGYQENPD